ncbi:MAG: response regulator transcription factor [Sphingomonadales bacterium]|nr:response regulator transcription factor [Sphingomonadales bacterium]NCQ22516.1 response regulator transcription factor [Sphingomonadales bacterium]NCT04952.1 response regulator transcription factor [Sphingomonadales bacterium]
MNAMSPPQPLARNSVTSPRFREAGDLTLDLLHSDGRVEDRWLALHRREFALLWRLAEQPGEAVTPEQLVAAIGAVLAEPDTASLRLQIDRLRAKLAPFGLTGIVTTIPDGRYALNRSPAEGSSLRGGLRAG